MKDVQARILIYVVCYNAVEHILKTLSRIPFDWLAKYDYSVLIGDDCSSDQTIEKCKSFVQNHPGLKVIIRSNERNLGYGGNQKIGYSYAINQEYEYVILLHGDGQYAPEYLPKMIAPLIDQEAEVILGSRMIHRIKALRGGMPVYKWLGNQVLTYFQNLMLNTRLHEFHTGYRAYTVASLTKIPFVKNSDYFDFDTEIIIQLLDNNCRIKEIDIPTFYGDEISYVNGFKYAWLIIKATIVSRFNSRGWISDPRFTYSSET